MVEVQQSSVMELYILRHGEAELRSPGTPDGARKLTPKGKRELRRLLKMARRAGVEPQLILTSPLVRARETAEIASAVLKCPRVKETRGLLPGADPGAVWREIRKLKTARVLLAGHQPHLGNFLNLLLGSEISVDLKKGALVRVAVDSTDESRGVLKWMITPKLTEGF